MREKINQAAKGIFKYSISPLYFAAQEIHIDVNAGESVEGVFEVSDRTGEPIRSAVSTDCHFLEFKEDFFQGDVTKVRYIFHGETLLPGDTIKGSILVISCICRSSLL